MPENESDVSLSAGRATRMRNPRSPASSRPASQRVVFPIAGVAFERERHELPGDADTKSRRDASSASRPTTPEDMTRRS